jgi:hypothetical protein
MQEEMRDRRAAVDIRAALEAADPLRSEDPLGGTAVELMRQTVLNAGSTVKHFEWFWPRALGAVALLVLMVIVGSQASRNKLTSVDAGDTKGEVPAEPAERRQLQFETPGGTRIIWTLDPAFKLEGVAP